MKLLSFQREVKRCIRDQTRSSKGGARTPPHAADDDCAENGQRKENGDAFADTDPLCVAKWIPSPMRSFFFLGRVQLEVVSALLSEKYKLETVVKEPSVIYAERPLKAASHTIHIEVPPNLFWASIGLVVTPLAWLRCTIREPGFMILEPEFSKRWMVSVTGWSRLVRLNVTDCKICFEYGALLQSGQHAGDFRSLALIVLEQALKESGTQLLNLYLSFILYAPQEYLSRAYHDAPKYQATIETAQVKKDEVVFTGETPARCIQAYRTDLAFYTNGRSACLTELKRISGRCRSAGHPAPPSKQPPGQGAPYVSEGNVKIHNRQDGNRSYGG